MLPVLTAPALVKISITSPARLTFRTATLTELTARYPIKFGLSDTAGAIGTGAFGPDVEKAPCNKSGFSIAGGAFGNCRIGITSTESPTGLHWERLLRCITEGLCGSIHAGKPWSLSIRIEHRCLL
jgi:hypothetical protein